MSINNSILDNFFGVKQLRLAYERIIRTSGKDIKDRFGINVYKTNLSENLKKLSTALVNNNYKPSRPFKYYQPKPSGTQRTKTVLIIEDAIVFQAIANQTAFLNYETLSSKSSYVFGSVLHDEVKEGTKILEDENANFHFFKYYVPLFNDFTESINSELLHSNINYKLETDITGFFDSIPHSKLLIILYELSVPEEILDILENCLNTWSGTRNSLTPGVGIPQGPAASFLFANIVLNRLDEIMIEKGFTYYRYMDDIRVYEEEETTTYQALIEIDKYLKSIALSINSKKTNISKIKIDREAEKQKFLHLATIYESQIKGTQEVNKQIVTQDGSHQIDRQINIIPSEKALPLYQKKIKLVEQEVAGLYEKISKDVQNNGRSVIPSYSNDLRDLAYQWRELARIIKSIGKLNLNEHTLEIWFFCLKNIFWHANYYCWNLNQYPISDKMTSELEKIAHIHENYEWIVYQIISNFVHFEDLNSSNLRRFYRVASTNKSPLVRLGYYMVIIHHVSLKTQLFETVKTAVRNEKNLYIKRALSYHLTRKEENLSHDIIKYWFGL